MLQIADQFHYLKHFYGTVDYRKWSEEMMRIMPPVTEIVMDNLEDPLTIVIWEISDVIDGD
jgi:hypothetical protein